MMDDKVKGYLFRVLKERCSGNHGYLWQWLSGDDFAGRILELIQTNPSWGDAEVLQIMKDVRSQRTIAWRTYAVRSPMPTENMRKSIRQLEKNLISSGQGFEVKNESSTAV